MMIASRRPSVAALLLIACAAAPAAAQSFPFRGVAGEGEVSARAGAGKNYYAVLRLDRGQVVTVHDNLYGWYAIEPPAGSFSYISREYVRPEGGGQSGVVTGQRVRVRAPSPAGPGRSYRAQVYADEGDRVKILGEEGEFYKIAPPAQARLYVRENQIQKAGPDQPAAERGANGAKANPGARASAAESSSEQAATGRANEPQTNAPPRESASPSSPRPQPRRDQTEQAGETQPRPEPHSSASSTEARTQRNSPTERPPREAQSTPTTPQRPDDTRASGGSSGRTGDSPARQEPRQAQRGTPTRDAPGDAELSPGPAANDSAPSAAKKAQPLLARANQDGSIQFEGRRWSAGRIEAMMRRLAQARPEARAIRIQVHPKTPTRRVIRIRQAAREAGFQSVSIAMIGAGGRGVESSADSRDRSPRTATPMAPRTADDGAATAADAPATPRLAEAARRDGNNPASAPARSSPPSRAQRSDRPFQAEGVAAEKPEPGRSARNHSAPPANPAAMRNRSASRQPAPSFEEVEQRYKAASLEPLDSQPLAELRRDYERLRLSPDITDRQRQWVRGRLEILKVRRRLRESSGGSDNTRTGGSQRETVRDEPARSASDAGPIDRSSRRPIAVGRLVPSALYTGEDDYPLLYRLIDPSTGMNVAYVAPRPGVDARAMLGRYVGVIGERGRIPAHRLEVLRTEQLEPLQPGEQKPGMKRP